MSLVRIDVRKGKGVAYRAKIGRIVYDALVSIGAPEKDRFQIIAEHEADSFQFDPEYLGIHRSADLVMIQITWNEGRTTAAKAGALQNHHRRPSRNRRTPPRGRLDQPRRG